MEEWKKKRVTWTSLLLISYPFLYREIISSYIIQICSFSGASHIFIITTSIIPTNKKFMHRKNILTVPFSFSLKNKDGCLALGVLLMVIAKQ